MYSVARSSDQKLLKEANYQKRKIDLYAPEFLRLDRLRPGLEGYFLQKHELWVYTPTIIYPSIHRLLRQELAASYNNKTSTTTTTATATAAAATTTTTSTTKTTTMP